MTHDGRHRGPRKTPAGAGRSGRAGSASGMTAIELMVSTTILIGLMLAFSTVLVQSRKVVSSTQRVMGANTMAFSVAQTIRTDLRRATTEGFLCISEGSRGSRMVLTTAGTTFSLTGGPTGTGAIVAYGLCDALRQDGSQWKSIDSTPANLFILYRCGLVLNSRAPSGTVRDSFQYDLIDVQKLDRTQINATVDTVLGSTYAPVSLVTPPGTLAEVQDLWRYLAEFAIDLRIQWTDGAAGADSGTTAGNLNWYGPGSQQTPANWGEIQASGGGDSYRALWTHHNPNIWPKAVKIRFSFYNEYNVDIGKTVERYTDEQMRMDPDIGKRLRKMSYEVICPIGS